jgi:GTP cyclohydrolase I
VNAAASLATIHPVELPDIQAEPPAIPIALDEAGVSDLRYPITLHLADGSSHHTVATVAFAASVAADVRGVHMSRFVEILHEWHERISVPTLGALLEELRDRLDADTAVARFAFPLFLERAAPITGSAAYVPYDCELEGRLSGNQAEWTVTVRVPVKSLCPCSREISDYGAHNQRGIVEISVELPGSAGGSLIDFSDLITVAEQAGSSQIYSVLKRPDERYVTMRAYENPAFVEDITRTVADALRADRRVRAGRIRVVNEESIHSHNAYATIAWQ